MGGVESSHSDRGAEGGRGVGWCGCAWGVTVWVGVRITSSSWGGCSHVHSVLSWLERASLCCVCGWVAWVVTVKDL